MSGYQGDIVALILAVGALILSLVSLVSAIRGHHRQTGRWW